MKPFLRKLIPAKYWYSLSNIKNSLGGYGNKYYSQFGEDIIVSKLFSGKNNGTYVDIGAHHPKRYSNTYLLYKRGWSGTNVDPNPHTIALFNSARPNDKNMQSGAGKSGTLTYYRFSDPAVNTFSKTEADKWMGKDWLTFLGTSEVAVRPLSEFMQEGVDLLTVDAEGMDLEILQTNDWSRFKPTVIIVESGNEGLSEYIEGQGYELEAKVGKSLVYKRSKY